MFSLRIVTTSQYQAAPIPGLDTSTSEFRASSVKRVPVLRIFGSTPAGQKTCMHVHGVFPYLYVPYDGTQPADRYLRQFAASLDKALNVANRSASAIQQHVYKISIVSGIPMYGYHPEEEQFLKIYLYNPNNVRKAADLMLGGAVMNKPFQPHESHIPYALQLFIDYNLYGMNLVNVAALKFRQKKKDEKDAGQKDSSSQSNVSFGSLLASSSSNLPSSVPDDHIWNVENIPSELLLPAEVERQSVCELEVDVVAADILNRQELTSNIGANPGLAQLWEDERQRCRDAGESSQIVPEPSQERQGVVPSESETELLEKFFTIVNDQQAFRDSQSEGSLSSQSSVLASQVERHISRQDSHSSSEGTVILEDEQVNDDDDEDNKPIISLDSIKKVVSFSQSFSNSASQKNSQDQSVADILASLLEEAGPPSTQLTSLEEKDSVLNQSTVRDNKEDEEEDEETLMMSQSLLQTGDAEGLEFEPEKGQDPKDYDVVMDSDEDQDDDEDDIDLLPQFDGASDHIPSGKNTTDPSQNLAETSNQNSSSSDNSSQPIPGQMTADSSLAPTKDMSQCGGETPQIQGYSSDQNSGFPHQQQGAHMWSGQTSANWQGQSPMWQQQQQQQRFHNWSPQHQQQTSSYPQQQMPYRATSPFHSPTHNSFASPGHMSSGFQSPSPSVGQHRSPFHYPGYPSQSPSASQQQYGSQAYQSPYQSPASSNHSYQQSPQPYQSPTTPGSQAYQSPLPYQGKPYGAGTSYQGPGYQASSSSQLYHSPTYPPNNAGQQMYQSPYQSPHQAYPPSYSSPSYHGQAQPGWSPRRDYQGYFPPGPQGVPQQQQQASHTCTTPGSAMHSHSGGGTQHTTSASATGFSGDVTSPQVSHPSNPNNSTPLSASASPANQKEELAKLSSKSQQLQQTGSLPVSQASTGDTGTFDKQQKPDLALAEGDRSPTLQSNSEEFKSPQCTNSTLSDSCNIKSPESMKKPVQLQHTSYARAVPTPNSCDKPAPASGPELSEKAEVTKPTQPGEKSPHSSPSNKISTLDFTPVTSNSNTSGSGLCEKLEKPIGVDASATPMIQQLLMEESPARKNIKPKDREAAAAAAMRKPMLSPSPLKPKKKSKQKSGSQGAKPIGRPRSSSASSPVPAMVDFRGGFSPQQSPIANQHQMLGKTGRSQSISLPFSNDPRMVGPAQGYGWNQSSHPQPQQMQWRQGYPAWHQHQHHQHPHQHHPQQHQQQQPAWGGNQWQGYSNPSPYGNGANVVQSPESQNFTPGRVQSRSYSADAAVSPFHPGMPPRHSSQSDDQGSDQSNSVDKPGNSPWLQGSATNEAKGDSSTDVKDSSSLSSLLQLVSDVGSSSDETGWDNVVTGLSKTQPNGNADICKKSTPTSESTNQPSPSVKDFITLETPAKLSDNTNGNCLSSEEFDQIEEDSAPENKAFSKAHPRLGKQNRLKRIGPKLCRAGLSNSGDKAGVSGTGLGQPRYSDSGSADNSNAGSPNPWYTYTFHVPTPVFKKLKFYQSAHARRQTVKVVRMHPMDARRYSLLKIGREVVRVARLTPQELARYNVTFPPPSQYASPDGSSNRVNLDIPTGSGDSHNGDGSAEEGSISFDTDFPPNKVAPPSSFDSSHVTASVQRSVAQSGSRGSPRSGSPAAASVGGPGEWGRHFPAQHQLQFGLTGYSAGGGLSPSRASTSLYPSQGPSLRPPQGGYTHSQGPELGFPSYPIHQPMPPGSTHGRHFNAGPSGFSMYGGQKSNENPPISPSASGLQNTISYSSNYSNNFMNNSTYPYSHHHQQQHHQHHQQQYFHQSYQQPHSQQPQYQLQHQHPQQQMFQQPQTDQSSSNMEQKNELRSPGQHGLASKIDREGTRGHSDAYKLTTGTLPVNTWVNARSNHADTLANINDDSQLSRNHPPNNLSQHCSEEDEWIKNRACSLSEDAYHHKKKKTRRKKRGSLSLKKKLSKREPDITDALDSLDGSANSDTDKDAPPYQTQLTKSSPDRDLPTKIVLKNVKSLRLKIPRPYSECVGNNESLDFAGEEERDPGSDSHEQLSDVSSKTHDSVPAKHQTHIEAGVQKQTKQSCRQAKMRSIYSSSARTDKKKKKTRKKKQEPLKEGVHYIIIGKFKGHQSMLVKIKRVPVSPGELVGAEKFEKLSAEDVIRQVELGPSPLPQSPGVVSNDEIGNQELGPEIKHSETDPPYELPSRSEQQGKRRRKFRSAFAKNIRSEGGSRYDNNTLESYGHPKNGEAGLMRVEARTNNNTNILSIDAFFAKLREAFLQHTHLQHEASKESPPIKTQFFEGVSLLRLSDFKMRLVKNLNRSTNEQYSSSSDEEEDILDEEILHQKLYPDKVQEYNKSCITLSGVKEDATGKMEQESLLSTHQFNEAAVKMLDLVRPACVGEIYDGKLFPSSEHNSVLTTYPVHRLVESEDTETKKKSNPAQLSIDTSKTKEKDDFLKRQMAFFEDISSTSESENETKSGTRESHLSPKCPPLRLSVGTNGIKILNAPDYVGTVALSGQKKIEPVSVPVTPEEKEVSKATNDQEQIMAQSKSSNDDTSEEGQNFAAYASSLPAVPSPVQEPHIDILSAENNLDIPVKETRGGDKEPVRKGQDRSTINDGHGTVDGEKSTIDSDTRKSPDLSAYKNKKEALSNSCEDFDESLVEGGRLEIDNKNGSHTASSSKRTKKRGKNRKRSVRDEDSVPVRRSYPVSKESSSNDESQAPEEKNSGFEKKRLRQRKQTYRFYLEDLDSSEDEIWGIEESSCSKAWSALTDSTKSKKTAPTFPDLPDSHRCKNAALGNSRRRKGPAGGGKLLNSLSLLHMATLANLTDAPQDSLDGSQSVSGDATTSTPTDQHSDKASGDSCTAECTPTLETLSFISPKTSDEAGVSPPVAISPTDKKAQEQARSAGQSNASRRLFHSAVRRASLKPGCNGSSGLGTRPLHLGHLVNESASSSPVPSNFFASENVQPEPTPSASNNGEESCTSTATVHQLLETRKAQVNCASFSMKDILRLATPDDSMDSDSKDSAAVVKPPEVRRAQVRSTSLSMSDILQLTNSASPGEESTGLHHSLPADKASDNQSDTGEAPEASTFLLNQLAGFGHTSAVQIPMTSVKKHMQEEKPRSSDSTLEPKALDNPNSSLTDPYHKHKNRKRDNQKGKGSIQRSYASDLKDLTLDDKQLNPGINDQNRTVSNSSFITKKETSSACLSKVETILKDLTKTTAQSQIAQGEELIPQASSNYEPPTAEIAAVPAPNQKKQKDKSRKCDETDGDIFRADSKCLSSALETNASKSSKNEKVASSSEKSKMSLTQSILSSTSLHPEISITCDENEGSKTHSRLNGQGRELNPLHPLQIPSYPYLAWPPAHSFPTAPASDSPMYRHPGYWHWMAQPSSSASSPLNLCTTSHRSPNNYSPITPTSPVSPYYPTHPPMFPPVHASSLSPPTKKPKPLWYPWLNVESSKVNSLSQPHCNTKAYQQSSNPSGNNNVPEKQWMDKEHAANSTRDANKALGLSHSIADLLAGSSTKPAPSKVNTKIKSSCETVSQFLGSVIDTAYSRQSKNKHLSSRADNSKELPAASGFQNSNTRANSVPDRRNSHVPSESMHHRNGEAAYCRYYGQEKPTSQGLSLNQEPISVSTVPTGPFSGVRKGDADRVRVMLENETVLRGQYGLPPLSSSSGSTTVSKHDSQSLTERLVSQLIKGNEGEKGSKEPVDGSRGRKRTKGQSSAYREGAGTSRSEGDKKSPGKSRDLDPNERDGKEKKRNYGDKPKTKSPGDNGRDLTIRPATLPPRRKSVEESLIGLGLNSVQPPVAFCSNSQDLPERPMEHGGRVLKVDSNRSSDVAAFPCSKQLVGLENWRHKLLGRPGQHTDILVEAGGLAALENKRQLRMLLEPDRSIVACPVRAPPSRASVVTWLRNKMSVVLDGFKTGDEIKHHQDANSLPSTETSQGDSVKSVKFSQHPEMISPAKFGATAADTSVKKTVECSSGFSSPPSWDLSVQDNSTLMDTDLDISCTPSQTPRPLPTQDESKVSNTPTASGPSSHDTQASPVEKKPQALSQSPTTTQATDTHFRKSKRRNLFASPGKTKEAKMSPARPVVCDIPLRRTSTDLFETSIAPSCEEPESFAAGAESSAAADQKPQLLKRISTNTENQLRKNVLSSQTQRQHSDLGFTAAEVSQIEGPTPKNTFGFKVTQNNIAGAKARHKFQNITTLSLELHVTTRGDLRPDPELDPIQAVFYSVLDDVPAHRGKRSVTGVILVDAQSWTRVAERQQGNPQPPQKKKPGSSQGDQAPAKISAPSQADYHSPPSSPRPVASQSPSPTPKKGGKGKGKGRGRKTDGGSPARPGPSSGSLHPDQALLEMCCVDRDLEITYVQDEMHLFGTLIDLVTRFDPDILVGYEVQMLSWGFLLQRAAQLDLDLCSKIARVQDSKENNQFSAAKDEWGADHMSEIHVTGRVVLNLWRIIRHEVALNVYTFENVAYHILHQRIPLYSFRSLTKWFSHKTHLNRWRVLEHYTVRVKGQLEVIDSLDLIGKTSEFARVFGIEFYDVLARGSQIRVESMMLRLAKPLNFVPVSPSVNQRARQRAPECIPLTLEPESQLYTSPVVVLDFQSLYPSIMIAYNYCFSTCLGRLTFLENAHEGPFEFGCTSLKVTPATLKKIRRYVTVSPNGVVFLKSSVRRGVLPRMVEEILNTRIMVKKSMKAVKDDKTMTRMLDARQLGLKLIANVTYGYTGASFSGRMPCIEVGDSIVRKARESLERAIELVRNTPKWGAQVVYGDTDSLFIHFPGRSKDEAFKLGHEIADAVTAMFPSPMKLKFEKVYLPCVLQTKKRYVGFMYETPDQKEPVYDAKGIETVRRDSCSAVSKILERSIKVMFSTYDLSRVRAYVTRQLHKLLEGKVSVLDLIFAKEFRGSLGYKPGACVPALEIARRRLRVDRRWEPRVGERVPYVIVHGPPGLPLIQLVREPHDLTMDPALRLNATYYITKQILPPLDRLFSLIGVNVFKWYQDMPKVVRLSPMIGVAPSAKQGTISQFFATTDCPVCEEQTKKPVCEKCAANPQLVTWTVMSRIRAWERAYSRLMQVCFTCQGTQDAGDQICISTDCPVMFRRIIARQDLSRADNIREVLNKHLSF